MTRRRHLLMISLLLAALGCGRRDAAPAPITVGAAADLAHAFPEVGAAFEKKTGRKVTFTFGSTGLLAKQVTEGAPIDVFAAANVSFVDDVLKAGRCKAETKALYGRGRIVVWTKKGSAKVMKLEELLDAKYAKIAIANPEHAPYGRAAKEAFEADGLWEQIKPKVVFGENVQQTLQFAQTGNAEAAIVALSIAMPSDGEYELVDDKKHQPLDQALVVCETTDKGGAEFASFVNSEEGRTIMRKYGFLLAGESVASAGAP